MSFVEVVNGFRLDIRFLKLDRFRSNLVLIKFIILVNLRLGYILDYYYFFCFEYFFIYRVVRSFRLVKAGIIYITRFIKYIMIFFRVILMIVIDLI